MMLRTSAVAGTLFGLSLMFVGCSSDQEFDPGIIKPQKMLYLQMAAEGTLSEDEGAADHFTLVLRGITQQLPFFSEQPGGATGKLSLQEFLSGWVDKPYEPPPGQSNGALITVVSDKYNAQHYRENAIVLLDPRYDVANEELIFTVQEVPNSEKLKAGTFSEPLLFIDSWDLRSEYGH